MSQPLNPRDTPFGARWGRSATYDSMLLAGVHQTMPRVLHRRAADEGARVAGSAVRLVRRRVRPDGVGRADHAVLDHGAAVPGRVRSRRGSGCRGVGRRALEANLATQVAALAVPGNSP